MGWPNFTGKATETTEVFFTYSKRGWTERALTIEWLRQLFIPQTAAAGRTRLLILDGHDSHVTMEFIETCVEQTFFCSAFHLLPRIFYNL